MIRNQVPGIQKVLPNHFLHFHMTNTTAPLLSFINKLSFLSLFSPWSQCVFPLRISTEAVGSFVVGYYANCQKCGVLEDTIVETSRESVSISDRTRSLSGYIEKIWEKTWEESTNHRIRNHLPYYLYILFLFFLLQGGREETGGTIKTSNAMSCFSLVLTWSPSRIRIGTGYCTYT